MHGQAVELLVNAGTGNGAAKTWVGGHTSFVASSGNWGGGSVKLQIQVKGTGTWVDIATASLSADGIVNVFLPPGTYRAVAATAIGNNAELVKIPY